MATTPKYSDKDLIQKVMAYIMKIHQNQFGKNSPLDPGDAIREKLQAIEKELKGYGSGGFSLSHSRTIRLERQGDAYVFKLSSMYVGPSGDAPQFTKGTLSFEEMQKMAQLYDRSSEYSPTALTQFNMAQQSHKDIQQEDKQKAELSHIQSSLTTILQPLLHKPTGLNELSLIVHSKTGQTEMVTRNSVSALELNGPLKQILLAQNIPESSLTNPSKVKDAVMGVLKYFDIPNDDINRVPQSTKIFVKNPGLIKNAAAIHEAAAKIEKPTQRPH